MAQAQSSANQAGDNSISDFALGMRINGNVVALPSQGPEKSQVGEDATLDEVLLMDAINMRVTRKQITGTGPPRHQIDYGIRALFTQSPEERSCQQSIADPGEGDHKYLHETDFCAREDGKSHRGTKVKTKLRGIRRQMG